MQFVISMCNFQMILMCFMHVKNAWHVPEDCENTFLNYMVNFYFRNIDFSTQEIIWNALWRWYAK